MFLCASDMVCLKHKSGLIKSSQQSIFNTVTICKESCFWTCIPSCVCVLQGAGVWGGASKVAATQDGGVRPRGHGFKPCPRKPV